MDARLLRLGEQGLWLSYTNIWGVGACRGHFVARLVLDLAAPPAAQAWLESTSATGGLNASLRPGPLASPRNGGLFEGHGNRRLVELVDVAPTLELVLGAGSSSDYGGGAALTTVAPQRLAHRVPAAFASSMHNSVHPLWIEEWGQWLGVGHRHYAAGTDAHGHLDASAPFQYGYAYRHVLFTLDARSLRMRRFSREFCLPALAAGDSSRPGDRPDSGGALDAPLPQQLCEGVQFIMSAFRHPAQNNASGTRSRIHTPGVPPAPVSFSYGINDCEAGLLSVSLLHLNTLLEFHAP